MKKGKFLKEILLRGLTKKAQPYPVIKKPRKFIPETITSLRAIWMGLFLTLPLDVVVAPFIGNALKEALILFPTSYRFALLSFTTLLILLPLIKEPIMQLVLDSQGIQREAKGISLQFQSLFSAIVGLLLLIDVARRVSTLGIEYAVGLVVLGLLLFPTWYRAVKKQQPATQLENIEWLSREASLERSLQQFGMLFFSILVLSRIGIFLTIVLVSVYGSSLLVQCCIVIAGGLVQMSGIPEVQDLFRVCRKCGLWSHRSFQVDNYCPGCARMALKSARYAKQPYRLERVFRALHKLDRGIEQLSFPSRKPSPRRR